MTPWFLGLRNYKNGIAIFLQWGSQKKTKGQEEGVAQSQNVEEGVSDASEDAE